MIHYSDCDCGGWDSMCESCQEQIDELEHLIKELQKILLEGKKNDTQ
jgi:hypothetical protein